MAVGESKCRGGQAIKENHIEWKLKELRLISSWKYYGAVHYNGVQCIIVQ